MDDRDELSEGLLAATATRPHVTGHYRSLPGGSLRYTTRAGCAWLPALIGVIAGVVLWVRDQQWPLLMFAGLCALAAVNLIAFRRFLVLSTGRIACGWTWFGLSRTRDAEATPDELTLRRGGTDATETGVYRLELRGRRLPLSGHRGEMAVLLVIARRVLAGEEVRIDSRGLPAALAKMPDPARQGPRSNLVGNVIFVLAALLVLGILLLILFW